MIFKDVYIQIRIWAVQHGIHIDFAEPGVLDPFFKGDLDGQNIWLDGSMDAEQHVFNSLHLIGHTIQWSTSEEDYELGKELHSFPDATLLYKLVQYEWQANCYGLHILQELGYEESDWMNRMFEADIRHLIHYYTTGDKKGINTDYPVNKLVPIWYPPFTPRKRQIKRKGIVI